ncbi:hypothetical protein FRC01_005416 [Tulasnella sp. 417]|nr:hypothetical protein FRC01_005416 [Tulasnella sp. 417]
MEFNADPSSRLSAIGNGASRTTVLERRCDNQRLPIHQLPPELLYDIIEDAYTQVSYKHLFALRSVCKHWMEIIESMPQLWAQIALNHNANLLSTILQKSATQPLEVSCKEEDVGSDNAFEERVAIFLQQIGPSAERWRSLHYSAPAVAQHERILGLPLYNLETLTVKISTDAINYTGSFEAPRLRNLDVNRLSLNWGSFSDLRSLQIDSCMPSPTVDELYALLKSSPNLELFKIARDRASATGRATDLSAVHSTPILLSKLQSIIVAQVPFLSHCRLLDLVEAPNLHRFTLYHHFHYHSYDFTPMFESAGRIVGAPTHSRGDDGGSRLAVVGANDLLAVIVGERRVILKNYEWSQGTRAAERPAGLSAILGRFDCTLRENIRVVRMSGLQGVQEITDLARVLNRHLPNVEDLELRVNPWSRTLGEISILAQLPSPPTGGREAWLFPELVHFKIDAPKGLVCDGVLEVLKARRDAGQVQVIRQLTIEGGTIRGDTVDELRSQCRELNMIDTEVA